MSFWRLFVLVSLPLLVLDFATKEWTVRRFADPELGYVDTLPVIPGFFDLVRVHNTGVAFGMANKTAGANWVFGAVGLGALFVLWILWKKNAFPTRVGKAAAGLLISGVLGNLLDRILRGYVVDFLHFNLGFMQWPAFNVADSCICIAAGLLFISAFQKDPKAKSQTAVSEKAGVESP